MIWARGRDQLRSAGEFGRRLFTVSLDSQTLNATVATGNPRILSLGRVSLQPGSFEIKVTTAKIVGDELMRLRSLELKTNEMQH